MNSEKRMEKEIMKIFDELGLKINCKGYRIWIKAILHKIENRKISMGMLYRSIAEQEGSTYSRIERSMRHLYEEVEEKVRNYFGLTYKVNNGIFLECMLRKLAESGDLSD